MKSGCCASSFTASTVSARSDQACTEPFVESRDCRGNDDKDSARDAFVAVAMRERRERGCRRSFVGVGEFRKAAQESSDPVAASRPARRRADGGRLALRDRSVEGGAAPSRMGAICFERGADRSLQRERSRRIASDRRHHMVTDEGFAGQQNVRQRRPDRRPNRQRLSDGVDHRLIVAALAHTATTSVSSINGWSGFISRERIIIVRGEQREFTPSGRNHVMAPKSHD